MNVKALALVSGALAAGALTTLAVLPSAPASAQYFGDRRDDTACLQNNRIWGWRVINERTLIVNDRQNRPFVVRLSGGCIGLTNANMRMGFHTWTNLGCLARGDRVSFVAPALGQQSCFVQDVQPFRGAVPGRGYQARNDQGRGSSYYGR
jgi:hypothetical protein